MTAKTVTSIEPTDIQSIEFECTGCHSILNIPLKVFSDPPTKCRVCSSQEQWLIPGSADHSDFINLSHAIKRIAESQQKVFRVRLQISDVSASREEA